MRRTAVAFVLWSVFPAIVCQAHRSTPRQPPPCRSITSEMMHRDLTLMEGCYTVQQFLTAEHAVTLAAGTTITFAEGTALAVDQNGSLEAAGTAEKPILLRGREGTAGFWGGLTISSNSTHNRLSYVTVEDAGVAGKDAAAITLAPGAQLGMDHSTVRRALGNGVMLMDRARFSRFEANAFAHTHVPLSLKATDAGMIDPATTFSDNTTNAVLIPFGSGRMQEDGVWRKIAVPYRVEGGIELTANLTIAAGAEVQFAEGIGINVDQNGSLTAIGTMADPVVLTGTDHTAGSWAGVLFSSNSSRNTLRYVELRFGGSSGGAVGGGVGIVNEASATVQASTLSSCPVGIFVARGGRVNADVRTANRFVDDGRPYVMEQP